MRRGKTTVLLALLIVFGMTSFIFVVPSGASPSSTLPDYQTFDVGPKLRDSNLPIESVGATSNAKYHANTAETQTTGDGEVQIYDTKTWVSLDDYYGYYFYTDFDLRAFSDNTEVWVQVFEERGFPEGDPRGTPIITQAEVEYLLNAFDSNIYAKDSSYFGVPDFHNGSNNVLGPSGYWYDEAGRNVILVSNFGDENFYDPTYPYYIAGFYSPTFERWIDRNIISIDTWQWENRIGPEGTEWLPGIYVARPYVYEGTIAHEFQHLIHDDYNTDDALFMNEGCSMFAEFLCGYGIPWGDINSYLATPDNSLTEWGDQGDINILADYGVAALWTLYLNDQFGPDFLGKFVQDGVPGIEGLNVAFGGGITFDEVYRNWRIANLIHSDEPGHGIYNYKSLDLADGDPIRVYDVKQKPKQVMYGTDFGTTITTLGYDTGISAIGPYGSDYIEFTKWNNPAYGRLDFDGDDVAVVPAWTLTDGIWFSGTGLDLVNLLLAGEATVDVSDPVLSLTTSYDLEPYWDFGFIQVSTDNGATWNSLANSYTIYEHDPDAHPDVIANLPGLTGTSDGYVTMDFDLSAYAGETVLIGFRYITDWGTTYPGWWIQADSVMVSGQTITLAPATIFPEVDFQVTMVIETTLTYCLRYRVGRHYYTNYYTKTFYCIYDLRLKDATEMGTTYLYKLHNQRIFMIVSPMMDHGVADYSFVSMKLFHCR
jgi:immune inhibitor A